MLRELFSEKSNISMMRLLCLISLITGSVLALQGKAGFEVFVLGAFGAKTFQKKVELDGSRGE